MSVYRKQLGTTPAGAAILDRAWWIDYRDQHGRRRRERISTDRRTAEAVLRKRLVSRQEGRFLDLEKRERITFARLADLFMKARGDVGERTRREDAYRLTRLVRVFGERYLDQLRLEEAERYIAQRRADVSGDTVNQDVVLLKHLMRRAVDWRYLRENPLAKLRRVKPNPPRTRYLEKGEIRDLLGACGEPFRTLCELALTTGCRLGEITQICWDDLDEETGVLHVRRRTKSGKPRSLPLTERLLGALKALERSPDCPRIFWRRRAGRDVPLMGGLVQDRFRKAVVQAGLRDVRVHDLRHSFGTHLAISGAHPKTIMELLGHSGLRATERYINLAASMHREAVHALGVRLGEVLTPAVAAVY